MHRRKLVSSVAALALVTGVITVIAAGVATVAGADTQTLTVVNRGTTSPEAAAIRVSGVEFPEFPGGSGGPEEDIRAARALRALGRLHSSSVQVQSPLSIPTVSSTPVDGTTPGLVTSFEGLNHFKNRFASNGNQFSLEPPDQGLCVGNGYVFETVNDVLEVYDTAGNSLTGPVALNAFYGYAPAIDRTTGISGPFVTDPSCLYDQTSDRWFHVVLTLDTDPVSGDFEGTNHLDLAVSATGNPLGSWNLYSIPVQNDGTDGTPNHHCLGPGDVGEGPCIGDYPHMGLDANGVYLTTNEYSFLSNAQPYTAAQLYAISKVALAHGASSIQVVLVENLQIPEAGQPGFTVWPANVPGGRFSTALGGTEFFASSMSTIDESHDDDGIADAITVWSLSNTSSLNTATPSLVLQHNVVPTEVYGIPPFSVQKAGDTPLADCLNLDCFGFGPPPTTQVEGPLNSNDSRMQQTWFAKGKLFASLDTAVNVGGEERAGIAWFVFFPRITNTGQLSVKLSVQGYVANENNNVTYPAIVADANGRGYLAFTLVGEDYYPSAAYMRIAFGGTSDSIHVAGAGVGPQDGFTEYFIGGGRPRWGDYGAATIEGTRNVWIASEWIGQSCTLEQYVADTSCGGTRSALANWSTRVTRLAPA